MASDENFKILEYFIMSILILTNLFIQILTDLMVIFILTFWKLIFILCRLISIYFKVKNSLKMHLMNSC